MAIDNVIIISFKNKSSSSKYSNSGEVKFSNNVFINDL